MRSGFETSCRRYSRRRVAWSSGSSPICREGQPSDCTLPTKSRIPWYLSSRANLSSSLRHVPINCRSFSWLGHLRDTVRSRDVVAARPRTWGTRQTTACWFYALIERARTGHDAVERSTEPDHRSWPPLASTSPVSWRETPSQWWDDRPGKVWSSWIVIVNLFLSTIC